MSANRLELAPMHARPVVMLVDDAPERVSWHAGVLRTHGCEVHTTDGAHALREAATEPPDAVVLELELVGTDGCEVFSRLRAMPALADVPLVVVVAGDAPRGLPPSECGLLEYLRRPFSRDELWARVGVLLRLRAANRELARRTAALEKSHALAAARARLEALDRARDDLFRLMSREIRTPLNGVFGVGELLIDQCGPEGDLGRAEELAQLFRASRARVSTVLENAELLCRIETRDFASSRLSLAVLTQGALTGLTPQEAAHVEVTEGPERLVLGDKALLEHGLRALLRTALRFARASPVRLRWSVESDATLLEIDARGDQVPPNLLAVFFEVVGAARAPTAGRELGLDPTVAHRVLSIFGAQLVAQNVAEGMRLSVWLPAPQPHLHQER